jgi:alcohol dehydrogenase class IV
VSEGLDQAVNALIARIESLLNLAGMARSLADLKVDPKSIPTLAKEAHGQWTRNFNPREVSVADFERLYQQAFEPRGNGDAR